MQTFFDPALQAEFLRRLEPLNGASERRWGTLTAAQMLAHCTAAIQMSTGELAVKPVFMGLFGWLFKGLIFSPKPFRRNVPTARELTIADEPDFDTARQAFLVAFAQLAQGPSAIHNPRHPFFGALTPEEWGALAAKHLDHHFPGLDRPHI